MTSDGPYKYVVESGDDIIVSSEGQESIVFFGYEAKDLCPDDIFLKIANKAYVYGRKAERERCLRMAYQYTTWEFDGSGGKPSLSVSTVDDIVAAIKGEKDGK